MQRSKRASVESQVNLQPLLLAAAGGGMSRPSGESGSTRSKRDSAFSEIVSAFPISSSNLRRISRKRNPQVMDSSDSETVSPIYRLVSEHTFVFLPPFSLDVMRPCPSEQEEEEEKEEDQMFCSRVHGDGSQPQKTKDLAPSIKPSHRYYNNDEQSQAWYRTAAARQDSSSTCQKRSCHQGIDFAPCCSPQADPQHD